ncbi:MAG: resolvase [Synechococcaceae cyanobacterium]|nr:resolvase [Synechococcaceae cyanobacterium]
MLAQPGPQPGSLSTGSPLNGSGLTGSSQAGSTPGLPAEGSAASPLDPSDGGADALIGIEDVQKSLNRSRASVYRYTNTDPRNLNPPFNPRKLNPEYRSDQKEPLLFHPHEVARFARDILRIKEVTVEVLNSPSTATQQLLGSILEELRAIRRHLDAAGTSPADLDAHRHQHDRARPAA